MFTLAAAALVAAMLLTIIRLIRGPSHYDRVLSGNSFNTKTMLLIAVLGFLTGRPDFLDIALVYALVSFVGTLAILKARRYGLLGGGAIVTSLRKDEDRDGVK
jgi:multicomponent Na+:H+ antiporter subunit F